MKRLIALVLFILFPLTCGICAMAANTGKPGDLRILNNFVTELLVLPSLEDSKQTVAFTNPRAGWVFVFIAGANTERADVRASLQELPKPLVFRGNPDSGALEAMLFLPRGVHNLKIENAAGGSLVVRAVPELMFCYYPSSAHIGAYGPYTRAYLEKHVLPHVNTLVTTGNADPAEFQEWMDEGRRWISNASLPGLADKKAPKPEDVLTVWTKNPVLTQPGYSGLIVDEFIGAGKGHYKSWTVAVEGLLGNPGFKDKIFYAWCGDIYRVKHEREFARMLMKKDQRFVWETYLCEEPTEEIAQRWIHQRIAERMDDWKKKLPGVEKQTVICLGYLSAPPETLNMNPGVDYQVFLDMQFHALAADPAFKGLYGLMEYMAAYADEESLQYAHKLIRHYCIEGHTDRVNADPYILPHLDNPDFAGGLEHWTAQPAEQGGITAGKMEKFSWLQGRYPTTEAGDQFACMTRSAKAPNRLRQTIKALEPGRVYSVKLLSANLDALDQRTPTALTITLDGAEIIPGMDFQFVYPSCYSHEAEPYTRDHPACFSFHRLVFRATAPEAVLTIKDWKDTDTPGGAGGQRTAFNFVEVQPCHLDLPKPFPHATYAALLRGADGHVDADAMVARLKELGVSTYYWLIWRDTDWADLKTFLPKAAAVGIEVWPYLVPPSESPPNTKCYSEPFRLDYQRWAEEIARLSLDHPNLTAWVIDDFYANKALYTPDYLRGMQERAHAVNPKLAFLPLMYFGEIDRHFVEAYKDVIDGVVVAYPQDRGEIAHARAMLDDEAMVMPGQLQFPAAEHSAAGDYIQISQAARVLPAAKQIVRFRELDDFYGATEGYHFKQFLVDGAVAWEQDAAGGGRTWQDVTVDITAQAAGKAEVTLAFRLMEKKGVANFPVRWRMDGLQCEGLELAAGLDAPKQWRVEVKGAFEAGFGDSIKSGGKSFHIPFVVMTAAQDVEFKLRHGDPVTPVRIAEWLRMCLECKRDGICDGVVTYCLDLTQQSKHFGPARELFHRFDN